jgi:pimeloyl-ACP methyl ester carboxylesterase
MTPRLPRLPGLRQLLAATLLSILAAPHADGAESIRFKPYSYKTRDGQKITDAEIGRIQVPENRGRPDGKQIELAFIRFKSTSPTPGPPIVWLAGGPGDHGSDDIEGPYLELVRAFQKSGDVIALDQRGTGLSRPNLECKGREIVLPLDQPLDRDRMRSAYRELAAECAEHWKRKGVDLAAYNTIESADDVEALRRALGVERISLYGASYGSHLGFAVLRRHGDRIHRAVLSGIEGPDHTWKLPSNGDAHFEAVAREFAADSVLSGSVPDLVALMRSVLAGLDRSPVTTTTADGDTLRIGGFELRLASRYFLGSRDNIARLGSIYLAMSRGDWSPYASIAPALRKVSVWSAMHDVMNCASGATPDRLARIDEEAARSLLGDLSDFPGSEACDVWPHRDLGDAFRAPVRSGVPVMFVSGTLDGHTRPTNVDEVIEGFPNGVHLTIERGSHQQLEFAAPEVVGRMSRFLGGEADPGGSVAAPRLEFHTQPN